MLKRSASRSAVRVSQTRWPKPPFIALLGIAGILAGTAPAVESPAATRQRTRLARALGPVRFAEGRLTGGFDYAPFRESHLLVAAASRRLMPLIRTIQATARQNPSPQAAADLAMLELLGGHPARAVRRLEGAAITLGSNKFLATDLSAAYLELGRLEHDAYDLFKALTFADLALAAPSPPIEASFNRALALERLAPALAVGAWTAYLSRDNRSRWATEARFRRSRLDASSRESQWDQHRLAILRAAATGDSTSLSELCRAYRQPARQLVEDELLIQWAVDADADQERARHTLAAAQRIGVALAEITGDSMIRDTIATIGSCSLPAASSPQIGRKFMSGQPRSWSQCHRYAEAFLGFGNGLRLYQARNFTAARSSFTIAERQLQNAKVPFSRWVTFYLAICDFQKADYQDASARLARLEHLPDARQYPILLGKTSWMSGLIASVNGRLTESLSLFLAAASYFAATGEEENHAVILSLLAENYSSLGDHRTAWRCRSRPLAMLNDFLDLRHRLLVLQEAVLAMMEAGAQLTALAFQDEAVATATSIAQPDAHALALRRRASLLASLGRLSQARHDLVLARSEARHAADSEVQRTLLGEILAVEGEIALTSHPEDAIAPLSAALSNYIDTTYYVELSTLYLQRSRALARLGRRAEVEADLAASVISLERQSRQMGTSPLRSRFLDQTRQLFDEAVGFYAAQGRAASALGLAERGRAQLLLALTDPRKRAGGEIHSSVQRAAGTMTPDEIVDTLPAEVVILEYAVLEDRLITWAISNRGIRLLSRNLPRGELAALVHQLVAGACGEASAAGFEESARRAYDLLVRPSATDLVGKRLLVVVPDQELYRVPFGALLDRATGTPLLANFAVGVAPSSTLYLTLRARSASLARSNHPPLAAVLGNPAVDATDSSGLGGITGAQDEALAVASLYPEAHLLLGSAATRTAFLAAAMDADVIHLAAHALVSDDALDSYGVVFAGQVPTTPLLRVEDLDLRRARLVFLSACKTARGFLSATEGPLSPARLILAAGVPAVVASLWDVDDVGAARLAVLFHRRLRAGSSVLESLRSTQLDLRRNGEPPSVWAAFEVLGGPL